MVSSETRRCYVCKEHKSLQHFSVSDAGTLLKKCKECVDLAGYGAIVRRELLEARRDEATPKKTVDERWAEALGGERFTDSEIAKREPRGKSPHNMWAAYPVRWPK